MAKTGKRRRSSIAGRATRHPGYAASQVIRDRVEEAFGWIKALRQSRACLERVAWTFTLTAATYRSTRLPALLRPAA